MKVMSVGLPMNHLKEHFKNFYDVPLKLTNILNS